MTLISIVSHFVKCFIFGLKCPRLGFSFRLKVGGKVQEKQLSFCGVKLNMGRATSLPFWFSVFKANPKDPSVSHKVCLEVRKVPFVTSWKTTPNLVQVCSEDAQQRHWEDTRRVLFYRKPHFSGPGSAKHLKTCLISGCVRNPLEINGT